MKRFQMVAIAFLIVGIVFVSSGCGAMQYRTPARQRRRHRAISSDFYRAGDDIDWLLGVHRPTRLYDQTLR